MVFMMAGAIIKTLHAYCNAIILALLIISAVGCDGARVSRRGHLKLRRQLRSLNKPAVTSIKTAHGDIFDCVNMHKQPALDHPLLRDHKIQTWPTSFPKQADYKAPSDTAISGFLGRGCPQGTVPIRRIRMRDLLRSGSVSNLGKKAANGVRSGHHWVSIEAGNDKFYGTQVSMNVWSPSVDPKQFSLGQFWIQNGNPGTLNTIEAGWIVNPALYGDENTRLFLYWTADDYNKTGCYNTLCPGFVQVSNDTAPGVVLQPVSVYNGQQRTLTLQAFKDVKTGNWWLTMGDNNEKVLGYWPSSLFNSLAESANMVKWGGEIFSPQGLQQPAMGSGRFPKEGFGKAAFMKMIIVVDGKNAQRDAPVTTNAFVDQPKCYNVDNPNQVGGDGWRRFFYFGGPGGTC